MASVLNLLSMKNNYSIVALIMLFWFVISFITNILGPLIPDIIKNFNLQQLTLAGYIPMSFFLAYAVMSIPAGIMIEKFSEKTVLLIGFSMPLVGALLFVLMPAYPVFLISCFIIGLGMAMLQTVINPLTRVAGGEANFAFFSVMGQLVFGFASFVSPLVYSYLVCELTSPLANRNFFIDLLAGMTPPQLPWVSLYWVFTVILVVIILIVIGGHFPKITLQEDEKSGSLYVYRMLLHNKYVYLFFGGILCYVATEQGIANWMSTFLEDYHGIDPQTEGAAIIGRFWGLMSLGCLGGLALLKLVDSKIVLRFSGTISVILLLCALFGSETVSKCCFPLIGFTISVLFSIIMSLGLNSVLKHHGAFTGILCSGIVGGAIGPVVVGALAETFGLQIALLSMVVTLAYIISISFWARPLVNNKTVSVKELLGIQSQGNRTKT